MPINTANLQLYKKDPVLDKKDTFNIELMLNENWDKIDNDSVFNKNHREDTSKHVTSTDKEKWNGYATGKASSADLSNHAGDTEKHVTSSEKINWNGKLDASAKAADSDRLAGQLASYYINIAARLGYTPLDAAAPSVDSERVGGYAPSTSALANTAAIRNSSGYLEAVIFKQSFASLNPNVGNIMTQISASDGYVRPTSPAQFIDSLKLLTKSSYGVPSVESTTGNLSRAVHSDKVTICKNSSAIVKTIPANTFVAGDIANFIKTNGSVTFTTGSGMTLYSAPDNTKRSIKEKNSMVTLYFESSTLAYIIGSLE